jgi:hypothetical protein
MAIRGSSPLTSSGIPPPIYFAPAWGRVKSGDAVVANIGIRNPLNGVSEISSECRFNPCQLLFNMGKQRFAAGVPTSSVG